MPDIVTLANGDSLPFKRAVSEWTLLRSWSEETGGLDHLYQLRQLCLGRAIPDEALDALHKEGVIASKHPIDKQQRVVVLSSLQGIGHAITVVYPFPDPEVARYAELQRAKDDLIFKHGVKLAQSFLMDELPDQTSKPDNGSTKWKRRVSTLSSPSPSRTS